MDDLDQLWARWDAGGRTDADLARLVTAAQPFLRRSVGSLATSSQDDLDDLISTAQIGLLSAIRRYDPSRGVLFTSFAQHRVKGNAREAMRSTDYLSRPARARVNSLLEAEQRVTHRLGRPPTDRELAGDLLWTPGEVATARRDYLAGQSLFAGTEPAQDAITAAVDAAVDYDLIRVRLAAALDQLSGSERVVMVLYYLEEMTMERIGRELGVTAGMVSKIRDRAAVQVMGHLRS